MTQNLIFLHGALGSKVQFEELWNMLSSDFELHSIDFSGHGTKFSSKEFSVGNFAEDVMDYMNSHKLESAIIFGYSMGGYVGLNLAVKFPERIEKLVTLGTKIHWDKKIAEREIRMLDPDKMEVKIPQFVEKLKTDHPANNWKELVKKTAEMLYGLGNGKMISTEDFKKIETPVMIVRGSEDKMVSRDECENLAEILHNGKYVEIPGSKHSLEQVDKVELVKILTGFLKSEKI